MRRHKPFPMHIELLGGDEHDEEERSTDLSRRCRLVIGGSFLDLKFQTQLALR